ncbi:pseudouridine synthase [Marinobacter sp.]|uniref:pseudouridine synthase n=1 Tax=Marinobacter sp. TaxID=50741 RepID=UPI0035693462
MKLSRILSNRNNISRRQANFMIASGRVVVNNATCRDPAADVDRFSNVVLDGEILQQAEPCHYLMLHKPAGFLSATFDDTHRTVMELIAPKLRPDLHIAGRLDRASTGLLILTNDGRWSRQLTEPRIKIPKVYRVSTAHPISPETCQRFAEGIWFEFEQLTTSPALLDILAPHEARVTIYEGRYHQVKRMFHAVGNRVTALHRERMGKILLDQSLCEGEYRALTSDELDITVD